MLNVDELAIKVLAVTVFCIKVLGVNVLLMLTNNSAVVVTETSGEAHTFEIKAGNADSISL